ncbi:MULTISPECIES: RDD family protein [Arcobacter]|jgi:uncharacterized RDD family membrane protein YckC|uniref:RDD family membrane protein n=1 Tax=Arcobacter ellisii TaxID=913109 RepID=A0A347UBZ6_9BACT|nr:MULTISPECIES: RDD family protein [Arcobacter]AXX96374.1 RDD family membrane protein [Arcobacter ellisii]MDD3007230.1 RDD family protein [Arcobacter sp.]MDY3205581.1 RDD family protein [Arcobacter sp.]RXI32829.1 hypothetical protein CP962_00040 [Arcobacter ellisii]
MAKWRDVKQSRIQNEKSFESNVKSKKNDLASLPSRFKAFLTDSFLITTPITYIVMYLILGGGTAFADNRVFGWSLILGSTAFIITFFWYVKFQTPGMKAYSLKIVNNDFNRISFFQAIIRYFATIFAMISFFLLFVPFFNKEKKTFQDIISKTVIINEK